MSKFGPVVTEDMVPANAIGFVYGIQHTSGKAYIGRKLLTTTRRKKIGVRAKKITKTRKTYETTVKDSGWMTYTSSCRPLQEEIKADPWSFTKYIIEWAYSRKQLSYLEVKHQMINELLERDSYVDNVAGKWYRRDVSPQNKQIEP